MNTYSRKISEHCQFRFNRHFGNDIFRKSNVSLNKKNKDNKRRYNSINKTKNNFSFKNSKSKDKNSKIPFKSGNKFSKEKKYKIDTQKSFQNIKSKKINNKNNQSNMNSKNNKNRIKTQRNYVKEIPRKIKISNVEDEIDNYLKKYQRLLSTKGKKIQKSKKSEEKNININKIDNKNNKDNFNIKKYKHSNTNFHIYSDTNDYLEEKDNTFQNYNFDNKKKKEDIGNIDDSLDILLEMNEKKLNTIDEKEINNKDSLIFKDTVDLIFGNL